MYGITEIRFVITVAPQKDICPHGSTYPKNAVTIMRVNSRIPLSQVDFFVELDENRKFRPMCAYTNININEAPFMWVNRAAHAMVMFRVIRITDSNESVELLDTSIARTTPVTIWVLNTTPSMNPTFHAVEIEEGAGKSTRALLIIFEVLVLCRSCFFILV